MRPGLDLLDPPITGSGSLITDIALNPQWGLLLFSAPAAAMWAFRALRNRYGLHEGRGSRALVIAQGTVVVSLLMVVLVMHGALDGVSFFRDTAPDVSAESLRGAFVRTLTGTVWAIAMCTAVMDLSVTFLQRFDRVRQLTISAMTVSAAATGIWFLVVLVAVTVVRHPF